MPIRWRTSPQPIRYARSPIWGIAAQTRFMHRPATLAEIVPEDQTVIFTLTAPIKLPVKTAAAIEGLVRDGLPDSGVRNTTHGNHVDFAVLQASRRKCRGWSVSCIIRNQTPVLSWPWLRRGCSGGIRYSVLRSDWRLNWALYHPGAN
jgi:hypothetical protein